MLPTDEPLEDDRPPSRSQLRREALDVLKIAESLAAMSDAELARVPLDEALLAEVVRTRAVKQHIARKRQTQFLAKQLRKNPDALEPIRRALDHDRREAHREAAALHRVESWRDRLVAEGDDALTEFLAAHPAADRQQLRQLVRQARHERAKDAPPRASRELFRALRALFETAPEAP